MHRCHHRFLIGHSRLFLLPVVLLEGLIVHDDTYGHEPERSSEVLVPPLRDPACALVLAGLVDPGIDACVGGQVSVCREVLDPAHFDEKHGPCAVADALYGRHNLQVIELLHCLCN